jgi:hypothetical protein
MIFNWEFYISNNLDLCNSELNSNEMAYNHFKYHGMKENRIYVDISIFFNWKEYITNNSDLYHIDSEQEAWRHFLYFGKKENRQVKHFDYLIKYCA